MPDTTNRQCTVSGGAASTQAEFTDMRSAADRLEATSGNAGDLRKGVLGIATSLPEKSAILSPGSAFDIAEKIAGLTLNLTALGLHMEFVATTLRWSASVYELTDEVQRQLLAAINVLTAPVRLGADVAKDAAVATLEHPLPPPRSWVTYPGELLYNGAAWVRSFEQEFDADLRRDPDLVDGALPWVQRGIDILGPDLARTLNLAAPPADFEGQIAWLLAAGRSLGLFNDLKPLAVSQVHEHHTRTRHRQLADVVAAAADVEHRSGKDKSVLLVRHVVGADGKGAWVVVIPGTSHWPLRSDHGPSDTAANLATMAGVKSSLYPAIDKALAAAMKESGVTPGAEPVMLAGHSQGGILATRLAVDGDFRHRYDVREVVTDGAPIDRIPVPDDVHVLSIENNHDIVPHADGTPTPDAMNRIDVTCDTPAGEQLHSITDAHDASRYARSAGELTATHDEVLERWYARNAGFLNGHETNYEFDLRRP